MADYSIGEVLRLISSSVPWHPLEQVLKVKLSIFIEAVYLAERIDANRNID